MLLRVFETSVICDKFSNSSMSFMIDKNKSKQ